MLSDEVFAAVDLEETFFSESLANEESILDIQPVLLKSENFHVVTREKTVYVTLDPTTVYVTVTEAPENPASLKIQKSGRFSTLTLGASFHTTLPIAIESSTLTKKETSSIIIVVKTKVEIVPVTKTFRPSSIQTAVNSEISETITSFSIGSKHTLTSTDTASTSDVKLIKISQVSSQLSFFLDKEQKPFSEISFPDTKVRESPVSFTDDFKIQTTSLSNEVLSFKTKNELQKTDSKIEYINLTKSPPVVSKISRTEFNSLNTAANNVIILSTGQSSLLLYQNNASSSTHTYSSAAYRPNTSWKHFLENFHPYTDFPTADYTMSNSGISLASGSIMGLMVAIISILI